MVRLTHRRIAAEQDAAGNASERDAHEHIAHGYECSASWLDIAPVSNHRHPIDARKRY